MARRGFVDRRDAGRRLARALERLPTEDGIVLGLLRGGLLVADEVAQGLGLDLDFLVVRKIGAPGRPELALGAMAENLDRPVLAEEVLRELGLTPVEVAARARRVAEEVAVRTAALRAGRDPPRLADRPVVVVDDGLATGATAEAAVRAVRAQGPSFLVLAVPVCPADRAARFRSQVDEFVALETPSRFAAVGLWYEDFSEVSDREVEAILNRRR